MKITRSETVTGKQGIHAKNQPEEPKESKHL